MSDTHTVRERAIVFGAHRGLVGVLTEPGRPAPGPRRAIVLSNVGTHHRVGPFRLNVELARRAAAVGWYALRFDRSGFGDSEPRPGAAGDDTDAVADTVDAMDWLAARCDTQHVVLAGLCSGVDVAHAVAVADARVAGAVFIDGYAYPTLGHRLRRSTRYLEHERWVRLARRKLHARAEARDGTRAAPDPEPTPNGSPAAAPAGEAVYAREYPSREQFRADVERVTARGARLLFIYTGTVQGEYSHRRQLFATLGPGAPRDRIDVDLFPGADHLFSAAAARAALLDRVGGWLDTLPAHEPVSAS